MRQASVQRLGLSIGRPVRLGNTLPKSLRCLVVRSPPKPDKRRLGQQWGLIPASCSAALRWSARQQLPIAGGAEIKKLPEKVREWIGPAPTSPDQVAGTPSQSREDC
jgi:hypothetical protein